MAAFHSPDLVTAASASSSAVPEGVHERATEPKLAAPAKSIVHHCYCLCPDITLFQPFLANQEIRKQFQQRLEQIISQSASNQQQFLVLLQNSD